MIEFIVSRHNIYKHTNLHIYINICYKHILYTVKKMAILIVCRPVTTVFVLKTVCNVFLSASFELKTKQLIIISNLRIQNRLCRSGMNGKNQKNGYILYYSHAAMPLITDITTVQTQQTYSEKRLT